VSGRSPLPEQPHAAGIAALLEALGADEHGLTAAEAAARLEHYGPNRLPHRPPPTVLEIVLRQFKSPLIYILGIAAVISVVVDHAEDAIFIGIVLALNAAIGSWQELRAERSSRSLQSLLQVRAAAVRDGEVVELDAEQLVPGDVVWLESGNRVPADVRLLSAHGLEVDESLLTGESLPVAKDPSWLGKAETALGDRLNSAFAGSIVVRGRAKGLVAATGLDTAVGRLALDVFAHEGGRAPLLERMEKFSRMVAIIVLAAAAAVALAGILLRGYGATEMFLFGVALAVSAIPEGLPVTLTVALAIATTRMARRGVIVRRLAAVEGLGSCTMIASDKTGTLTCNELTVREIRLASGRTALVSGEGFAPEGEVRVNGELVARGADAELEALVLAAVLCNEATLHRRDHHWIWHGDPTEVALLTLGEKLGMGREALLDRQAQVAQIPFEPEHQFSATWHRHGDAVSVYVKGSPERVVAMCSLGEAQAARQLEVAAAMAARGYRVLAFATGAAHGVDESGEPPQPQQLSFLGFAGMIDPLRAGARDAVAACAAAGIVVTMITGDHPVTALAIARDLGMAERPDQVVTGAELAEMDGEQLREVVRRARVFARTSPRQKLELVDAARAAGHYVAVTGDGVNDAPALRAANIGVAMGKSGTDVARETAELIITDDSFATIVSGVEEGRVAYDNVRKVIYLLISCGAAEVLMLGLAVITGLPDTDAGFAVLPLLPVQILWLNLVTNGIQDVAVAFEPSEGDVLSRRPRPPSEPIFNRLMIERTVVAAVVMAGVGFAAFIWMIEFGGWTEASARNTLLLLMVLFQNIHIGNCRSETKSAFALSPLKSPILLAGAIAALLVHVAAMHLPLTQRLLRLEPVSPGTWITLVALALSIIVVMELHKIYWRRKVPPAES
jgi:Ca2+-transporting ATPase